MILPRFHQPAGTLPDVCIVGSGPVGIALALECERHGLSVLLLESGAEEGRAATSDLSRGEIVDPNAHAALETVLCRAFGGTSWIWGGRCVPFDDIDFEHRPFLGAAHWPIAHADVSPCYDDALTYLGGGATHFRSAAVAWTNLPAAIAADRLERWSVEPRLARLYRERLAQSRSIALCLDSTITGIVLAADGDHVAGLAVAGKGGPATARARRYVLAAGGLESTRLLLLAQRQWPSHFGGREGALGRYYAGHMSGKIASIVFANPSDIHLFDFALDEAGGYVRRRFTIEADTQRSLQIQNIAFWADNAPFSDPGHRSGVLSAAYLVLTAPVLGRLFLPEAIRTAHVGRSRPAYRRHLANVLRRPLGTMREVADLLRQRILARPRRPGFLVPNPAGRYALHYHAEQAPNADSRVALSDRCDDLGVPRLAVDLRFSKKDASSVVDAHRVLDSAFRAAGKARLEEWHPEPERVDRVLAQASDGAHQLGTTRMGSDPRTSVVDAHCRVHGLRDLFVVSSGVFPTTGQANPTLLAVALAVRAARHIAATAS